MGSFFRFLAICTCLVSIQAQALERTKFIFSKTESGKGSLIIDELDIDGTTAFQNIELELNLNDSTFNLKKIESTDVNFIVPQVESINGGVKVIDSWQSSGGRNQSSFRNHHYTFDIIEESDVTIKIDSSVDNYLYLINDLGFIVRETDSDTLTENLSSGNYTIIVATYNSFQHSNYALTIQGNIDNIRKKNSKNIDTVGDWVSSGGRTKDSFRNDHFKFNVNLDSYIDMTIESSVDNYFYLINSLGFIVVQTDSDRLVSEVSPGEYTLVVATYNTGEDSNYVLNIVGQYDGLREIKSENIETINGWTSSGGRDRNSPNNPSYSFTVTEESLLDITIVSSVDNYLYLVDSIGNVVEETDSDRLTAFVPVGQYKLVAATYSAEQSSNFVLNIYGQFKDFFEN